MSFSGPSEFYLACRNNKLDKAKHMIVQMTANQINRLEQTREGPSTALHVAAYYGHYNIVKLLLEYHADKTIRNFMHLTASSEAKTRDISCLLRARELTDVTLNNRFNQLQAEVEWIPNDNNIQKKAEYWQQWMKINSHKMEYSIHAITTDYLEQNEQLTNDSDFRALKKLFRKAAEEHDPKYIVKAYTLESDFYRSLNENLSEVSTRILNEGVVDNDLLQQFWSRHGPIAHIIAQHPSMHEYSFTGDCYRGIQLTREDFFNYKVDRVIMNKTFMSASTDQEIVLSCIENGFDSMARKFPTICKYTIVHKCSAFNIAKLSRYPREQEVLIPPFNMFEIKKITWKIFKWKTSDGTTREIEGREMELRECKEQTSGCRIM